MGIDISQFIQAFLDESFEGVNLMESELLADQPLAGERINAIFRAAHSIKGSAGTFGFPAIGEFTHGVETLLDQIRSGERALTEQARALLLAAVDRIREMLFSARDGAPCDIGRIEETRTAIAALLASPGHMTADAPPSSPPAYVAAGVAPCIDADPHPQEAVGTHWRIEFTPHKTLLSTGNDPLRIFAYLRELGDDLQVHCDHTNLPPVDHLQPESCYLRWTLTLRGALTEGQIREAFEWVEDQCELDVRALASPVMQDAAPKEPAAAQPAAPSSPAGGTDGADETAAGAAERRAGRDRRVHGSSIRVPVEKVDKLVDLVGELIISQAMLTTISQESDELDASRTERLCEAVAQLERNTRELQEAVLSVRMMPINFVFSRFPRLVRDLSTTLGKQVDLVLEGQATELDKGVIEKLVDPLTHIVRNAIDHGIEAPDVRLRSGKAAAGTLTLSARHQGGNIVIEISDDGAGLDRQRLLETAAKRGIGVPHNATDQEVWQLIFAPGFSTAETITDISGRGVGMDVVRRNVESINGRLDVESNPGRGTRITIRLPLTLAILDGMSVRVGEEIFILPLTAILESLQPVTEQLHSISGRGRVVHLRGDYLPLVSLSELFELPARHTRVEDGIVVIVESAKERAALAVDELIAQHQVVIKSLETNYRKVPGVAGATIMGDGRVALILDVDMLTRIH